jgi:hypothetical protein
LERISSKSFIVVCLFSALLGSTALAGEGEGEAQQPPAPPTSSTHDADLAIKLPNFLGLSGMRDMIDARVPTGLTIRGGLRLQQAKESLEGPLLELDRDTFDLQAYAGLAALELFEVGARLPFELDHTSKGVKVNGGHTRKKGDVFGDLDLGAKLSIKVGPVALAPYALATLPSGDRRFSKDAGGALGGAATVSLFDSRFAVHANIDGGWFEGGNLGIRWRFGVSAVPLATKILLLRPFVYLDGRQRIETNAGTELRVAAGAQALLLDFITLDAGFEFRFLSQTTPSELANDQGTWKFEIGAGVVF